MQRFGPVEPRRATENRPFFPGSPFRGPRHVGPIRRGQRAGCAGRFTICSGSIPVDKAGQSPVGGGARPASRCLQRRQFARHASRPKARFAPGETAQPAPRLPGSPASAGCCALRRGDFGRCDRPRRHWPRKRRRGMIGRCRPVWAMCGYDPSANMGRSPVRF